MDYIYIGKIVSTHGIKGEVKIISDFFEKDKIFKKGFKLYITPLYHEEVINTYRVHKNYDMVTFNGYNDINEILKYIGMGVYIKRSDLDLKEDEYLLSDLIGYAVYDNNKLLGKVSGINFNNNVLLKIDDNFYIPFIDEFIEHACGRSLEFRVRLTICPMGIDNLKTLIKFLADLS